MSILLYIVATTLMLDVGLIGGILIGRLLQFQTPETFSDLNFGTLLVVAGVLTAFVAFLANLHRARSQDLLGAATDLLEKAYEKLMPHDDLAQPSNSRRTWLSAARLIKTAERLGKELTESSHKLIYRETREYWRTKLSELIYPSTEGLPSSFYAERPEHMNAYSGRIRPPLDEKSMAFLYRFIRWPQGLSNQLDDEPSFTDEEIRRMQKFGPRELGNLLAEVRRLRQSEAEQ